MGMGHMILNDHGSAGWEGWQQFLNATSSFPRPIASATTRLEARFNLPLQGSDSAVINAANDDSGERLEGR